MTPTIQPVETETTDNPDDARVPGRMEVLRFHLRHPLWFLFALSLLLLSPVLIGGLPWSSDDGETHVRWQYYYGRQLWAGDPFPRWISDIADGFGSPVFFIYPPLPHYFSALLTPLSDSTEWVQHRLGIATILACFLGSVGCFLWFRQITQNRRSALMGAIVYLIAPYHLFIDTYFRAAYAELWALAVAPLALAGIQFMTSQRRIGIALYVFGVAALLMSHAPSALILIPFFVIYSCLVAFIFRRRDILIWTGVATCNAILLAGIYLGTALTQQTYINTAELYTGYFNFNNWLIFNPNPVSKTAFNITGVLQAALTLIFAGAIFITKPYQRQWRWLVLPIIFGTCLLFFMMTSFSAGVWALIPLAQKIQFPWRLQTAQTILLALSVALLLGIRNRDIGQESFSLKHITCKFAGWSAVLILLGSNAVMLYRWTPEFNLIAPIRTVETAEYTLGDRLSSSKYFHDRDKAFIAMGEGSLKLLRWEPRNIEFNIDSVTSTEVLVKQFTYTGWTCRSSGGDGTCEVLSIKAGDILRFRVAPGSNRVRLSMPEKNGERFGKLASLAGLVIAATSILFAGRVRQ
jgi:hypothetical protein